MASSTIAWMTSADPQLTNPMAFGNDGSLFVMHTDQIWQLRLRDGAVLNSFHTQYHFGEQLLVSPNRRVLSGVFDGHVLTWDIGR